MAKPVKAIAVAIVIVAGGGLYALGNHYAKAYANKQAKLVIENISKQSPLINNIAYKSIDVGILSYFTHNFSIDHVTMNIGNQPMKVDAIRVDSFDVNQNNQIEKFNITFDHIALDLDKNSPVKFYLDMVKSRKDQLDSILEKAQKDKKPIEDPQIKAYAGWFEILNSVTNKYLTSYGVLTLNYDQNTKELSTDLNWWLKNNSSTPLMRFESNLDDVVISTNPLADVLATAKPQTQVVELNLDHFFQTDSKKANQAVKTYLYGLNPTFDMKLDYRPSKKSVHLSTTVNNSYTLDGSDISKQYYTGTVKLKDVDLNQYSLSEIINQTKPLAGFDKAYIDQSNSNIDANFDLPKTLIAKYAEMGGFRSFVELIPYKHYDFYINGKSDYNEASTTDNADIKLGIKDKLGVTLNVDTKILSRIMVPDYYEVLMKGINDKHQKGDDKKTLAQSIIDTLNQSKAINDKIQLNNWQMVLVNYNGFIDKLLSVATSAFGMPESEIKDKITASVNTLLATKANIFPVNEYQNSIDAFINQPTELSLSIAPQPPVTIAQFYQTLIDFMNYQQQQALAMEKANKEAKANDVPKADSKTDEKPQITANAVMLNKDQIDEKSLKEKIDQLNISLTKK